jgi:hypothetical protein
VAVSRIIKTAQSNRLWKMHWKQRIRGNPTRFDIICSCSCGTWTLMSEFAPLEHEFKVTPSDLLGRHQKRVHTKKVDFHAKKNTCFFPESKRTLSANAYEAAKHGSLKIHMYETLFQPKSRAHFVGNSLPRQPSLWKCDRLRYASANVRQSLWPSARVASRKKRT